MDAVNLLTADHNRVRGLFSRYREAHEADDVAAMSALAAQIFEELEVHTAIEEEIFYPAVHDTSGEVAEVVDEGVEEHHVATVLMGELAQLDPGSDRWVAKMVVLMENVEHHADEEEREMFPLLRHDLDDAELEHLAHDLEEGKSERGAPTMVDTIGLTRGELAALAREQQIPGRSSMGKEELAASVAPPAQPALAGGDGA